jgi:hypothetical protein
MLGETWWIAILFGKSEQEISPCGFTIQTVHVDELGFISSHI